MIRYSLRLPDSLHEKLKELAEAEGVSLNQYLVYALARQAWDPQGTGAIQMGPPIQEQRRERNQLRAQRQPAASPEELAAFFQGREPVEEDRGEREARQQGKEAFQVKAGSNQP